MNSARPAHHFRTALPLFVLAAGVVLAGCGRDEGLEQAGTVAPSAAATEHKASEVSSAAQDKILTAQVSARLASDSQLGALDIQVETSKGRVLLRGVAPDTAVRGHATELARTVAGVVDVNNDLSVQVPHR